MFKGKTIKGENHNNEMGTPMGRMDIILPDDLEKKFRQEVANRLGMKRGNLKMAVIQAIQQWIETGSREKGR